MDLSTFANETRDQLIAKARSLGVDRPELMTRVELTDEIVRRTESDPLDQKRARGWLGVARDLVASVVESGLNLPDAAALIRGERDTLEIKATEPVATVTLAEIYAAQGHTERALAMLDEVLTSEPDHDAARRLRERLLSERAARSPRSTPRAAPLPDLPATLEVPAALSETLAADEHDTLPPEAGPDSDAPRVVELEPSAGPDFADVPALEPSVPSAELAANDDYAPAAAARESADAEALLAADDPVEQAFAEPLAETASPERAEDALALAAAVSELDAAERVIEPIVESTAPVVSEVRVVAPAPAAPTLILLRGASGEPAVCWDLGSAPLLDASLRVVCIAFANADGAVERNELSLAVGEQRGRAVLESVEPGAVVRAALGIEEPSGFLPIAIASEIELRGTDVRVLYRPPGTRAEPASDTERELALAFGR